MNVHFPAPQRTWPGRLVNLAVVVVVLALAAATFVLSYPGLHAIVLQAGVSDRLARIYPGLFDAVFAVACVAAVVLRDARWWARFYAWLVIILVVAVVGAADAVHAMNVTLPHRETEGVVAAAPWVLVLLGFTLMLTMLRQSRAQHAVTAPAAGPAPRARELPPAPSAAPAPEAAAVPGGALTPEAEVLPEAEALPQAEAVLVAEAVPEARVLPEAEAVPEARVLPESEAVPLPEAEVLPGAGVLPEAVPLPEAEPVPPQETVAQAEAGELAEPAPQPDKALATYADSGREPAVEDEPAPAPGPGEEGDGERALAAQTSAATGPELAATRPESVQDSEEGFAILPVFRYWESDEETGSAGQDHPPTVPSSVIDDDAPPFATAPFATIPRLNRVRSTPTPPEDDDEAE